MSISGRRKGAQFVSSPSDSSLATNLLERKSPREERNTPFSHKHVISEKNAPLPDGNKMVYVDSSGAKHTVPLEQSKLLDSGNIGLRRIIDNPRDKNEFDHSQITNRVESKELQRENHNLIINKTPAGKDEGAKKKVIKYLCKNRPLANKRKGDSSTAVKASKSTSKTLISKVNQHKYCNAYTQTAETQPERKLSGIQRSSERIFYPDERNKDISLHKVVAPQTSRLVHNEENREYSRCSPTNISTKNLIGDHGNEFMKIHSKTSSSRPRPEIAIPLHERDTINVRNLTRSRTPQRYSMVEPIRCKVGENTGTIYKEFKKINNNGILRRTLTMVLFTVILFWFLSALFRVSIPGDLFRMVINYLSTLPVFVKRRKRELTKAEIVFKYIGSFLKLVSNIFGESSTN